MYKDTIVFINRFPLGGLFEENLELNRFAEAGYKLVYLDMATYYYPDVYKQFSLEGSNYIKRKNWFVECKTKEEVVGWIKKYARKARFYVLHRQVSYQLDEMWLYWAFKKYKCEYIIQDFLPVPVGGIGEKEGIGIFSYFFSKVLKIFRSFRIRHLLERTGSWFSTILMGRNIFFQKPTYCFVAGSISYLQFKKIFPKSKIVEIPSVDYFRYRRMMSNLGDKISAEIPIYEYLLYVDQSVFASPDAKILGLPTITKDIFFKKINQFFTRLENITGKKVVIAATSRYYYKGDEYGGRDIVYNQTPELTYYANLVIVHSSAALNFAVIMHKPLVFLAIDGFDDNALKNIKIFATSLRKRILNSEEDFDVNVLNEISEVNHEIYDCYIFDYITQEPFKRSPTDIIVTTLKMAGCEDEKNTLCFI